MNATYIVRPDYIEITTFDRRLEEKVTRVFPVADLVIPIPDSVNQQTLFQNLPVQNQQLAIFGQVLGAAELPGVRRRVRQPGRPVRRRPARRRRRRAVRPGRPCGNSSARRQDQGNQGVRRRRSPASAAATSASSVTSAASSASRAATRASCS